ncbi:MAG: prepilin peptidase [Acidobacteriaceae bacterium]|nr:prepilin peptidase [Acidobacteriaceae bacterium]
MSADFVPYVALAALAGLLIGSFLNVCIYRIPRDLSVVTPRSFCPECGRAIAWYDNIPLFSFLLLRGRCRACGQSIPLSYPLVELSTSVLFAFVAYEYGWTPAALKWFLFEAILVALFWIDLEERILPNELTLGGIAVGLIFAFFIAVPSAAGELLLPDAKPAFKSLLSAAVASVVLVAPIWVLGKAYSWIRKRDALGGGDVKLLLLLSVFLGLERGLFATLVGALGGTFIGGGYMLATRRDPATYQLPFGTFLCAGASLAPLLTRWIP